MVLLRVVLYHISYYAVDANTVPVVEADGASVLTIESLGDSKHLHLIQDKWVSMFAMQSGYDTSGFIMTFVALLLNTPSPSPVQIEKAFDGTWHWYCYYIRHAVQGDRIQTHTGDS